MPISTINRCFFFSVFFFFYNCCPSLQIKLHVYTEMEEALPKEYLWNLISLHTLYLIKCPLPQGMWYLNALQDLRVCNSEVADLSNDWDEMEWQGLRTLLSLQLSSLPKLVSLLMGLQYVSSLQNLEISISPILKSQVYTQPSNKKIQNPYSFSPLFCLNILLYFLVIQFQMHNQMKKQRNLHLWDLIKAFGCCNCSTTHSLDYILSFVFLFPLYLLIKNYVNFLSSNFLHFNKFHPFF